MESTADKNVNSYEPVEAKNCPPKDCNTKSQSHPLIDMLHISVEYKVLCNDLIRYSLVPVFVLFFWRGVWELMDIYVYPNNMKHSAWGSIVLGYGGLIPVFFQYINGNISLQSLLKIDTGRKVSLFLLVEQLYSIYVSVCVLNAWRGLWYLQVVYLIPSDQESSAWTSALVGTGMLILLQHFRSTFAPPYMLLRDSDEVSAVCYLA